MVTETTWAVQTGPGRFPARPGIAPLPFRFTRFAAFLPNSLLSATCVAGGSRVDYLLLTRGFFERVSRPNFVTTS